MDLDKPDLMSLMKTIWRVKEHGEILDVRLSRSGSGLHILCSYPDGGYCSRVLLGDDALRAEWDITRPLVLQGVIFRRELKVG